eukprot:TRINITY_DN5812_c0_g1_i1.p1 TRINITY_DN5812_c0_g1~~TRINITY_DN5812_c0_g1_i1.p1  ORF type:complete len:197 (-),score=32.82 TRINITY_DN5812_c0_g1_i1:493-1083(-)
MPKTNGVRKHRWETKFTIKASRIRGAGKGLFAAVSLSSNYTLPVPYRGKKVLKKDLNKVRDCSYVFFYSKGRYAAVDALHTLQDNPLRYVNGAATKQQHKRVNLRAKQIGGDMRFITKRRIAAGEELLLDYGDGYWTGLRRATRRKELLSEIRKLSSACKNKSGKRAAVLEEQLARARYDMAKLNDGTDSEDSDEE